MTDSQNYPPPGPQQPWQQQGQQYPPSQGQPYYGPQYSPQPGQPMRPQEERTWSLLAHIATLVLGFVAPLIVLLAKGNDSPVVRGHAVESLNFQITATIGYVISSILTMILIGFVMMFVIWALAVVFAIVATIAASESRPYRYPFALRLVT